ncbi:putative F-box/FBD/LRR-repeat protein At4g03220, partial [Pyrus x bretschneideri]|uniref:putative F-box/FBD/LRR-repeat protein At4g03220 n=1 Tax=Pyrus x bretschneideri TaxID=225117 RepID=UPI0020301C1C
NSKSSRASEPGEEEENKPHDQNSDRISNLPDAILHQTLSLLPIKTIAQTSVLSRRWSYLWASYPVLDFSEVFPMPYPKYLVNEKILDQQTKAMKSITTVLSRRHENSNIRVFRVSGHLSCSDLYDFIGRVVKHRVEELSLEIWPRDNCEVPYCLIECDSLRSLKLETGALQYRCIGRPILLKLSSKSGLRSLHSLSLTGVHFSESALDDVDLFTSSSFPSLERLTVEYCKNMSHDLIVRSPNLKDVEISMEY